MTADRTRSGTASGTCPVDPAGRAEATPDHGLRLERAFAAGDLQTRAALIDICAHLAAAGVDEEDLGTVELALAEVLNNIAEHSYGPQGGPVRLSVSLSGACLICEVTDQGAPMPLGQVPRTELPAIAPPAPLPEGGFGWHIVRCLVSDLTYARTAAGNVLRLRIPMGAWG